MLNYHLVGYVDTDRVPTGFLIPIYRFRDSDILVQHQLNGTNRKITQFRSVDAAGMKPAKLVLFAEQKEDLVTDVEEKPFYVYRTPEEVIVGQKSDKEFRENLLQIRKDLPWRSIHKEDINRFLKFAQ